LFLCPWFLVCVFAAKSSAVSPWDERDPCGEVFLSSPLISRWYLRWHANNKTAAKIVVRLKDRSSTISNYCNTLQHAAAFCNTLQHTATHCNTLQHVDQHQWSARWRDRSSTISETALALAASREIQGILAVVFWFVCLCVCGSLGSQSVDGFLSMSNMSSGSLWGSIKL